MHLFVEGLVEAGGSKGSGAMWLTESSAFFFLNNTNVGAWAAGGGLIGAMIGQYLARKKAEKNVPAHMSDPEIQRADEKTCRKLLTTKLLVKLPLSVEMSVVETRTGFQFRTPDGREARIGSWANKKKISRVFFEKGIVITRRK